MSVDRVMDRQGVDDDPLRPWTPPGVPEEMVAGKRLSYVVVDEIAGDTVTLAISAWPGSDTEGRVRFEEPAGDEPACIHLLVHRKELHAVLYEPSLKREPLAGDTFAAEVGNVVREALDEDGDVVLDDTMRLAEALPGRIFDLTKEARNVAKLAFFAAVGGTRRHRHAQALGQAPRPAAGRRARECRVRAEKWTGPVLCKRTPAADARWTLPPDRWPGGDAVDLATALKRSPDDLFYFLLNIGDGDAQLLLLPEEEERDQVDEARPRRAIVVDAGTTKKLSGLMSALGGVLPPEGQEVCALVVATHPHDDHIEGLAQLIRTYGRTGIGDFWEPGYYAPTRSFAELMAQIEDAGIRHCEPTAGMVRYVGGVKITVLAPSVRLRTEYDTRGVQCNDASIVLKVEFPTKRISTRQVDGHQKREDMRLPQPWSIVLGADAQTRSWANVTTDFIPLHSGHNAAVARAIRQVERRDHLRADILKVSHHASKHGINIELIERIHPDVTLISSVGGGGRFGFPHMLATTAIAEALDPSTGKTDAELGIHYTGGITKDGDRLGSIALQVPAKRGKELVMWRFGDRPKDPIALEQGRRLFPVSGQ